MVSKLKKQLTYKDAGVDVSKSNALRDQIKKIVKSTFRKEVLTDIGGFGGLFAFNKKAFKDPVLVSSTDGVGTKLKVACMAGRHDTVGVDLVCHCANDIVVQGARPLFFLDYIGMGKLDPVYYRDVIKGLANGCKIVGCSLIGGETAEMPGMYRKGEYDLVGTMVGVVDRKKIVTGKEVVPGDVVIGLPSSGLHTNGYSLARKILFEKERYKVSTRIGRLGNTVGDALLAPHKDYSRTILQLLKRNKIKAMAHITGGGFIDNIPRVMPGNVDVVITEGTWKVLPIFPLMQEKGNVRYPEMYRTFNMGIGMVLIVGKKSSGKIMADLKELKEKAYVIGEVTKGKRQVIIS